MEKKKKKLSLTSFAAGITAGGLILVAGSITSIFNKVKGSISTLLISIAIVCAGIALYKILSKKKKNNNE